jgi:hypothetical protein
MAKVEGGREDVELRVDANPDAVFFKERAYSKCEARVCGACGYFELYATDPVVLLDAWHRSGER